MINLRRVTEAIVAPGSITGEQLADGAIDLDSSKVVGQAPGNKIKDGAIGENKIADNAITNVKIANNSIDLTAKVTGELPNDNLAIIANVNKLQDGLVTLAKTNDDVRLTPFVAGENEQSVEGTTEVGIVETGMTKKLGNFEPKKVRVIASLKVSVGNLGTLNIYADDELVPRLTLTSSETDYELVNGEFDVSDLSQGKHNLIAKMKSSLAEGIVYNDLIEVYVIK